MFIPFDLLPEAKDWKVGKTYRLRLIVRQNSTAEDGATFEIIDAVSLEPEDKGKRRVMTDEGGYMKM